MLDNPSEPVDNVGERELKECETPEESLLSESTVERRDNECWVEEVILIQTKDEGCTDAMEPEAGMEMEPEKAEMMVEGEEDKPSDQLLNLNINEGDEISRSIRETWEVWGAVI